MARNVGDLGLFLDALAGPDPREPFGLAGTGFRAAAEAPSVPRRVAWSPDLGITPVDSDVARICAAAAQRFEDLGAVVEEASPDMTGAHEAFQTLRAVAFATGHLEHLRHHRDKLKPDIVWNIEKGLALTGEDIARANAIRSRLTAETARFFETYDLLLTPATVVPPFAIGDRTVEAINGQPTETYIDWLAIAFAVTLTSAPALSLPCGFTTDGLPVGLQIVAPLRSEAQLLSHAGALEEALAVETGPIDPRNGDPRPIDPRNGDRQHGAA